jgi:gluconate 2-dehydrogenase gamma chain
VATATALPLLKGEPHRQGNAGLSGDHWRTLDAVLEHLLPSEADAPGAGEANALAWLQRVLLDDDTDAGHKEFLRAGIAQVEAITAEHYPQEFAELPSAQRETVLRAVEHSGSQGSAWLQEIIRYILEALLSDPVYGGNPNGVGWKWLRHTPGFPRPPREKRYFLL